MSKSPELEFAQECVGFIKRDEFPCLCSHYNLDGTCTFFLPKEKEQFAYCDDIRIKTT